LVERERKNDADYVREGRVGLGYGFAMAGIHCVNLAAAPLQHCYRERTGDKEGELSEGGEMWVG
jgi:hypothetical protein